MARRDPETRYRYAIRHEVEDLDEFLKRETDSAEFLLQISRLRNFELPDDEYRVAAFFKNAEYRTKPGSLALLYQTGKRLNRELPPSTKETIFDMERFRFKMYCAVLRKGGYG
jgi:hypothetical protein